MISRAGNGGAGVSRAGVSRKRGVTSRTEGVGAGLYLLTQFIENVIIF